MKIDKNNKIYMTLIIFFLSIVLFTVMFMQFKTVEETDITAIENMREDELRTAISEWKGKFEETEKKVEENKKTIEEYENKIEKNEEASELIDKDLAESNLLLGKTDVTGEGVIITLKNTENFQIQAPHLLELINELRYAGAQAISINDARIINTEIVEGDVKVKVCGQRVAAPYVVKAIGNQIYLSSILGLKDSGFNI